MHIKHYLAVACGLFMSYPASIAREINWTPIVGWTHPEITAYIDTKSLRRDLDKDHAYGIVLFYRKRAIEVTAGDLQVVANSLARYIIVDCKNNATAPIADFYFNTAGLPENDKPLAAIDYSDKAPIISDISKQDAVYKTLCTRYI